jgi:DNA polymerase III alpha subunit
VFPSLALSEGEDLIADYASLGLTLGRHPLALLRPQLVSKRMVTAIDLKSLPQEWPTRVRDSHRPAALVRPPVSSSSLEDETGMINVVVWSDLAERQQRELLGSRLMEVHGRLEREGEVTHDRRAAADRSHLLGFDDEEPIFISGLCRDVNVFNRRWPESKAPAVPHRSPAVTALLVDGNGLAYRAYFAFGR